MRYRCLPLLAFLFLACGTSNIAQRPANVAPPDLDAQLVNEVYFGRGTTAPATIEVRVRNNASIPITVLRIEVQSPGMNEWGLLRETRVAHEVIEPGATKSINVFATARTLTSNRTEPLSFEVKVQFASGPEPQAHWQQRLRVVSIVSPR